MSKVESIARLYSSRDGLPPDIPTFVGRADTLRDLFGRLASPWSRPSVAILGPRRIGKSSLLKQILSSRFRERFLPGAGSWKCVYLDCSSSAWKGFDDFRQRLLRRVYRECGIDPTNVAPEDNLEDIFADLFINSDNPLLALIDEFDYIAPELHKEEQAELRAAINNLPHFALIIGIAQKPGDLLEYVGDVVSDLAPVIHIAQPTLGAFSELDARTLVRVGRKEAGLAEDTDAEEELLPRMGTHPLLVHAACYGWYTVAGTRLLRELRSSERETALSRVESEIASQLRHLERTISSDARSILEGQAGHLQGAELERAHHELSRIGIPRRQILGRTIATKAAEEEDPVEALTLGIADLNKNHQRHTGRPEPIFRPTALVTNDIVYFRRTVTCEEDFKRFVESLARLLYDGSDAVVAPELRGKIKPKLPKCCYQDERSILVHLVCLRNHYIHLPVPDEDLSSKHLKSVGDVFEKYTGARAPIALELEVARKNLLVASNRFVRRLTASIPLTNDLHPEILFG